MRNENLLEMFCDMHLSNLNYGDLLPSIKKEIIQTTSFQIFVFIYQLKEIELRRFFLWKHI